jgi:protein dispatched 1
VIIFLDCWKQIAVESDTRKEGEYTMEERVKHTMMRAGKAMLVTSSTTCGAFLATATSGLMPIAQFGIFAAMMIISNYIMVVTYFPACVVIWDIYLKHVPCCCCFRSAKTSSTSDEISKSPKKPKSRYSIKHKSFDLDDYTKTEAFIYTYFTPFVMRYRLVFLVIMGLWSIFMSYQLSTLELAKTSPVPLPSDHPFYKAVTAVETRYASSTSDPSMHLLIVRFFFLSHTSPPHTHIHIHIHTGIRPLREHRSIGIQQV